MVTVSFTFPKKTKSEIHMTDVRDGVLGHLIQYFELQEDGSMELVSERFRPFEEGDQV